MGASEYPLSDYLYEYCCGQGEISCWLPRPKGTPDEVSTWDWDEPSSAAGDFDWTQLALHPLEARFALVANKLVCCGQVQLRASGGLKVGPDAG